jgi:surface protein
MTSINPILLSLYKIKTNKMKKLIYLFLALIIAACSDDDNTAPEVTLIGESSITVTQNTTYEDAGAIASDNVDGDLTSNIVTTSNVDTSTLGTYTVTHSVSDASGNNGSASRQVGVVGGQPTPCNVVWIDDNGVTVKACDDANVGDTGEIDEVIYTVVDEAMLRAMVANEEDVIKVVTTKVTDMNRMFYYLQTFNQDISSWDVSKVTDMSYMFAFATSFNQDIGIWDVSKVINMSALFINASTFNQPLNNWDVSNVINMSNMFEANLLFNQELNRWQVGKVQNMSAMFSFTRFNQDISSWDVSSVTDMGTMFNTSEFNKPINEWDVSNVTDMNSMFAGNLITPTQFNQPLNNWNVGSVTDMNSMFFQTIGFNQNLSSWNVDNVISCSYFSFGITLWPENLQPNFNQDC